MVGGFMSSVMRAWVKATDLIRKIDSKLTGARYRPSLLGALLMLAAAMLFLPLLPLGYIVAVAERKGRETGHQ